MRYLFSISNWNSTFYICLIMSNRRLAKWGCRLFPEATAQRIRFWTFRLTLSDRGHAKDVPMPFLGERFWRHTIFELLTPKIDRSYRNETQNLFWERQARNGKISKFRYETIHTDNWMIHIFLRSFVEIGKAEVTKPVRGIHRNKKARDACEKFARFT